MPAAPSPTIYHRWLGWHAPALRRLVVASSIGLTVGLVLLAPATWELALIAGWNASALVFLVAVGPIIARADGPRTGDLVTREDETRGPAGLLLVGASLVSLLAVGFALGQASRESGGRGHIAIATLTVVLSWTVANTVFTLRYAHLYFSRPTGGIEFGDPDGPEQPAYRDFAYVAFTIGMTCDPSDPALVGSVVLPCSSHTLTTAGISGGALIVYSNNSSSSGCVDGTRANDDPVGDFMDVIAVPLADPAGASLIHREPLAGPTTDVRTGCHDAAVILGDVNKAACASADTINVWDIGDNGTPGGSPEDPALLFTIIEPGVGEAGTNGRWHSAGFTWDGQVIVAGWDRAAAPNPSARPPTPTTTRACSSTTPPPGPSSARGSSRVRRAPPRTARSTT
ncbi:MAG TPA: DUF1345 domain-containing protein, partial [Acidimicrobiales bacterium]|nr:DUF1345 domain-containing protein [Acidimicrobiales bacterium]